MRLVLFKRGYDQRWEVDGIKGVKYVVTERNLTMREEHKMQYIYALLLNCTPETYLILLTNTPNLSLIHI